MDYKTIVKLLTPISDMCENLPERSELGKLAMELIGDYPLYASGLSNIMYGDAIAIATIMFGKDIRQAKKEQDETDRLMEEYFKTDGEHSLAGFDKWVAEKGAERSKDGKHI